MGETENPIRKVHNREKMHCRCCCPSLDERILSVFDALVHIYGWHTAKADPVSLYDKDEENERSYREED